MYLFLLSYEEESWDIGGVWTYSTPSEVIAIALVERF